MTQEIERLVEPIARAIAIADGKDPDMPAWIRYPGGYPEGICWRDQYAKQARAVLQSDALSGLIKREEELSGLCAEARDFLRANHIVTGSLGESIARRIDAALNPKTEGE